MSTHNERIEKIKQKLKYVTYEDVEVLLSALDEVENELMARQTSSDYEYGQHHMDATWAKKYKALVEYAQHMEGCGKISDSVCSCGLNEILLQDPAIDGVALEFRVMKSELDASKQELEQLNSNLPLLAKIAARNQRHICVDSLSEMVRDIEGSDIQNAPFRDEDAQKAINEFLQQIQRESEGK